MGLFSKKQETSVQKYPKPSQVVKSLKEEKNDWGRI